MGQTARFGGLVDENFNTLLVRVFTLYDHPKTFKMRKTEKIMQENSGNSFHKIQKIQNASLALSSGVIINTDLHS